MSEYVLKKYMKQKIKMNPASMIKVIAKNNQWQYLYCFKDTPFEEEAFAVAKKQLEKDLVSDYPSCLAKYLKSETSSSEESKALAKKTRKYFKMTNREYRKNLSYLRQKI